MIKKTVSHTTILKLSLLTFISLSSPYLHARPPDTLYFPFAKYVKVQELLRMDPVRHVCINATTKPARPSALIFNSSINFINDQDSEFAIHPLPVAADIKMTESANGKYIYVYGPFADRPGGFHYLFRSDGKTIFTREDSARVGLSGLGLPLEGLGEFILARDGILKITKFDGKLVAKLTLLNKERYEDGDILVTPAADEKKIFVIANKFKMPKSESPDDRPILYCFDQKLRAISQDTLPYLLVIGLECRGKYLMIRAEQDNNTSPLVITDTAGRELTRFENPQSVALSSDSKYVLHVGRSGKCQILSSRDWSIAYSPAIPRTGFSWSSSSISDDGSIAVLYDGDELFLIGAGQQTWSMVDFPYAFKSCRLFDNGSRLILTGEFGAIVYEIAPK